MAIMMNALLAASVLATFVAAVPMPQAPNGSPVIVRHTHTVTTWTTIDVTTTVYANEEAPTPPPAATTPAVSWSSTPPAPAPEVASPAPEVASPAPVPAESPAAFAQEAPSPSTPAYTPPAETPAPSPAPAPAAPSPAAAVEPKASSGGPCEGQGNACSGDITYYNGAGGYGACGSIIDDSTPIVALPVGFMGSQSNGNPYCGRTVSIKGTDGSIHTGTVADKCMGCSGHSIDLTPVLFKAVAPNGDGRVGNIDWWLS